MRRSRAHLTVFAIIAPTWLALFYFTFWFCYEAGDHTTWWKGPTVTILFALCLFGFIWCGLALSCAYEALKKEKGHQ